MTGRAGDDDRVDRLAPAVVGHAEHGGLGDGRVAHQRRLDLERVDVLAARDDHVPRAVEQVEVAVVVGVDDVAGAVPAVDQRLGGLVRAVPVAEHDVRAADPQLAVAHVDLDAGHRDAHRGEPLAAAAVVLAGEVRDRRRGLGHPVELGDVAVRQPLEHAALELGGDRRRRVLDVPQRAQVGVVRARRVEQHPEHGRHEHGVGDALALDRLQHGGGVEARQQHLLRARPRAGEQVGDPGDVEHRAHVQPALAGAVAGGDQVVLRVGEQVAVREHHALRPPGGAAGVGDRGEGVGREIARWPRRAGQQVVPLHALAAEVDVLVGDQHRQLRVLGDDAQLLGREPVVEAHDHAARRRHAQPRLRVRARVGGQDAHPRSRLERRAARGGRRARA